MTNYAEHNARQVGTKPAFEPKKEDTVDLPDILVVEVPEESATGQFLLNAIRKQIEDACGEKR